MVLRRDRGKVAALSGERKKFNIRYAKTPRKHPGLSGVVIVKDSLGVGVCHISFHNHLPETLGKYMPVGVSHLYPAYLHVAEAMDGNWEVSCYYLYEKDSILAWVSTEKPSWVKDIKRFTEL